MAVVWTSHDPWSQDVGPRLGVLSDNRAIESYRRVMTTLTKWGPLPYRNSPTSYLACDWNSYEEAGEQIGITRQAVRKAALAGKIASVKKHQKEGDETTPFSYLIHQDEVERYRSAREARGEPVGDLKDPLQCEVRQSWRVRRALEDAGLDPSTPQPAGRPMRRRRIVTGA